MDIDTEVLTTIRERRTVLDFPIPYQRSEERRPTYGISGVDGLIDHAVTARRERISDLPVDEPAEKATIPDTIILLQAMSGDGRFPAADRAAANQGDIPVFTGMFRLAVEKHAGSLGATLPATDAIEIVDEHHQALDTLRASVMARQHRDFLKHMYDPLSIDTTGVPKAFWYQHPLLTRCEDSPTIADTQSDTLSSDCSAETGASKNVQSGLGDF